MVYNIGNDNDYHNQLTGGYTTMSEFLQNKEHRINEMLRIIRRIQTGENIDIIKSEEMDFIKNVTLEVTQDLTEARALEGERRLLDRLAEKVGI